MDKKALISPITLIFLDFVFIIIWVFFLASHLTFYGAQAAATAGATGIEKFFWENLNFWVMFGFIVLNFAGFYVSD